MHQTDTTIGVEELQSRVLAYARQAVRRGAISENRLAILIGLSQPHLHHILNGKRAARPRHADAIARALAITPLDLYTLDELHAMVHATMRAREARLHAELESSSGQ